MATKPRLSREYVYVPMGGIGYDVDDLEVNAIAFKDAGVEPAEIDWIDAIVVNDAHAIFEPSIGESLALLVGPDRGDTVTTEDLALGDYQLWVDAKIPTSDERIVRVAGILTVSLTG